MVPGKQGVIKGRFWDNFEFILGVFFDFFGDCFCQKVFCRFSLFATMSLWLAEVIMVCWCDNGAV